MTERTTILQEVGQAFRENGLTAAITALVGGSLAIAATVTRKAFTNEAMLERLDRELREYPKLCVSDRAHAVFRYGQASKRPANIMAS